MKGFGRNLLLMTEFEIKYRGLKVEDSSTYKFNKDLAESINVLIERAVAKAKENVKENESIDRGVLVNSIEADPHKRRLRRTFGSTAEHSKYVEFGTGTKHEFESFVEKVASPNAPHTPAIDPLMSWAKRHGMDERAAYAIRQKITNEGGLDPKPFIRPVVQWLEKEGDKIIVKEMQKRGWTID